MIVEIDGARFDVPDDATPDEIDSLTRPAPKAPGMGDLQASEAKAMPAAVERERVLSGALNVPTGMQTGDPATDRRIAENLWGQGHQKAITKGDVAHVAAITAGAGLAPVAGLPAAIASGALLSGGMSDKPTTAGVLEDAAIGGATSGAVTKLLPMALHAVASRLSPKAASMAESAAVRSANADRTAYRRAFKGSDEAAHRLGRFMLDEPGIALRTPSAIKEGAQDIAAEAGPRLGDLAKAADQSGVKVDLQAALDAALSSRPIAELEKNAITRGALGGHAGHGMGPPGIKDVFADWLKQHGTEVAPSTAHDIRMQLDRLSNWDQAAPKQVVKAWRAARDAVDTGIEQAMSKAGLGDQWAAENARFGAARTLSNPQHKGLADIGAERRAGNRWGSPSEKGAAILSGAMAAAHNPAAAAVLPATVALNRFGMPVAARSLDALSKVAPAAEGQPLSRAMAVIAALKRKPTFVPSLVAADDPHTPDESR